MKQLDREFQLPQLPHLRNTRRGVRQLRELGLKSPLVFAAWQAPVARRGVSGCRAGT